MGSVVIGMAGALACLFALGAVHKLRIVSSGMARLEPLIVVSAARRRHAAGLLTVAATVEGCLAAGLLAAPRAALPVAAILLVLYTFELRRLPGNSACHCFVLSSHSTASAAVRRNIALATLAAAATAAIVAGAAGDGNVAHAVAVAIVILAALLAVEIVARLDRVHNLASPSPGTRQPREV